MMNHELGSSEIKTTRLGTASVTIDGFLPSWSAPGSVACGTSGTVFKEQTIEDI